MPELPSTAHFPRAKCGRESVLFGLSSGTSRPCANEAGGGFELPFLPRQWPGDGGGGAKGIQLPPNVFQGRHPYPPQQVVFELPRPSRGFTQVFQSFWTDHPEFQLNYEKEKNPKVRDPDVLRFNHQRHFAADIPAVNGQKLDCNYCHRPDPDGRFYQRISFNANCQACHSLQFDARNPDLRIPHGDVALVRTFLRTLPAQYGDYGRLKKGISGDKELGNYVAQQIRQLMRETLAGGSNAALWVQRGRDGQTTKGFCAGYLPRGFPGLRKCSDGPERRARDNETDSGRSMDDPVGFQSRQTYQRQM
jgi:hypothetical protein